jgi:type II secretory ATPase GspE/PulE/Tfp pilus assembly ATPase PilB-like protein
MRGDDALSITAVARRNGMRSLREDGWLKISRGLTTPDEVMRVTQEF